MTVGSTSAESGASTFSRHVAITLVARMLMAGSNMLAGIIVARWLGAASVGVVASLAVVTVLVVNVGGFGIPSTIALLIARDNQKVGAIVGNALLTAFVSGGAMAGAIVILALWRPELFGQVPPQLLIITAVAAPFQMLFAFCLAIFLGRSEIVRYNFFETLSQVLLLISPFISIVILGYGLREMITLNAAVNIIVALVLFLLVLNVIVRGRGHLFVKPTLLREMLGYGSRFFVAMVATTLVLRSDLLIVNYFRGPAEAGVYAISSQVGTLLLLLPNVISTILFPLVTETKGDSGEMTCRVTRHTVLIMLVVCIVAIPVAFVLPLLYGPAFSAVPIQVLILLPGVFLLGIEMVQVQFFNSLGVPKAIPVFWIVTMLISTGLNLAVVPAYGAIGAAAVSSVSYTLMFVLVAVYFNVQTKRSIREAFLIKRLELLAILRSRRISALPREGKA